ncbi:MAG: hypothetical protein R6U44_08625 [Archaeoglobaceae archaeon]
MNPRVLADTGSQYQTVINVHNQNKDIKKFIVTKKLYSEYLNSKAGKRQSTINEFKCIINQFLERYNWTITTENVTDYIEWRNGKAKRKRDAEKMTDFLKYIQDIEGVDFSTEISLLGRVTKPKEERSLFAEEKDEKFNKRLEDIHNTIDWLIEKRDGDKEKLLYDISCLVLGASTGIRPNELTSRHNKQTIHKELIDLENDYFVLPHTMTKIPFNRVIPLHKDAKWILEKFFKYVNNTNEPLWSYNIFQKEMRGSPIGTLGNLRKLFTKLARKQGLDQLKRVAIQGHDQGELMRLRVTEQFYEKYTAKEISKEYHETIGKLSFLTDRQKRQIEQIT